MHTPPYSNRRCENTFIIPTVFDASKQGAWRHVKQFCPFGDAMRFSMQRQQPIGRSRALRVRVGRELSLFGLAILDIPQCTTGTAGALASVPEGIGFIKGMSPFTVGLAPLLLRSHSTRYGHTQWSTPTHDVFKVGNRFKMRNVAAGTMRARFSKIAGFRVAGMVQGQPRLKWPFLQKIGKLMGFDAMRRSTQSYQGPWQPSVAILVQRSEPWPTGEWAMRPVYHAPEIFDRMQGSNDGFVSKDITIESQALEMGVTVAVAFMGTRTARDKTGTHEGYPSTQGNAGVPGSQWSSTATCYERERPSNQAIQEYSRNTA